MGSDQLQFDRVVKFLVKYSWIFDFKVINFFSEDRILNQIPRVWKEFLSELSVEDFNEVFLHRGRLKSRGLPGEVEQFISEYYTVPAGYPVYPVSGERLPVAERRGVGCKKEHEVVQMAAFLTSLAPPPSLAVDAGAGLGYLGEQLRRAGLQVLGLEGSPAHSARAEHRRQQMLAPTFPTVRLKLDTSRCCLDRLEELVPSGACLVGLHCCGDLTPDLLDIFLQCPQFQRLAVVSCCYHRMSPDRFPRSQALSRAIAASSNPAVFGPFLLRLGAQEPLERWARQDGAEHINHARSVGHRAVLEVAAAQQGIKLIKRRRRAGVAGRARKTGEEPLLEAEQLVETLQDRFQLPPGSEAGLEAAVRKELAARAAQFPLLELLTGLQCLLQPVIERLITEDRLAVLRESPITAPPAVFQIFSDSISPRNKLLFAEKLSL